jgi:small subunit ribosomal protein S9
VSEVEHPEDELRREDEPQAEAPETSSPEAPEPELSSPEAPEPEPSSPEAPEPELSSPEAPEPELSSPEAPEPELSSPEAPEPELPRPEEAEPAPVSEAQPPASTPVAETPAAPAEVPPAAEAAEPQATEPQATEPQAMEPQATEPQAAEPQATEPQAPPAEAEPEEEDFEEIEIAPREKPEIPGADLIPDIVQEGDDFLDAEAQAAAEAEAEAAAARAQESEEESRPIADAAIDLAAGARYTATGKRKTSVARVILRPGTGTYAINGKPLETYFPRETLQRVIRQPLETVGYESRMDVIARMHGGGVSSQAGALRHGISRALIVADPNLRGELKRRGFLTRDPRVKERKKAGLKKARKRPQFSKR